MPLQPVKDIEEYEKLRNILKTKFQGEKTGEQTLLEDRTKLFKPLISIQRETSKAIQDKIVDSNISNTLVPLTREFQRKNDQIEMLMEQPFFRESIPEQPLLREAIINLNAGLDTSDIENLNDMSFELPNVVFEKKTIGETLQKIKTENRSIGQMLGKGPSSKTIDAREKGIYESRKNTLEKYSKNIRGLEGAEQFEKTGKGLKRQYDVIYYSNPDDLLNNFLLLCASKQAGNTG